MSSVTTADTGEHSIAGASRSIRASLDRLAAAQKSPVSVPAYMRYINRPAGRLLAAVAHCLGLTPTQVSGLSATASAAGIAVLATTTPSAVTGPLASFLLLVGFAFDSADGQLARLRGGGSPAGEWLDHVVDVAKTLALHGAVAIALFRVGNRGILLLAPLGYLLATVTVYFSMMLRDQLLRRESVAPPVGAGDRATAPLWKALLLLPLDTGTISVVVGTIAWSRIFVPAYAVLLAVAVAFAARALPRTYFALIRSEAASSA